ncbi:MAG: amidohydrolase family protein [Planctomycetota bacterium]|nr:amidohydrolase family protein [Planctomycetota bacterium]
MRAIPALAMLWPLALLPAIRAQEPEPRAGRSAPVVAVRAGHIHPVSSPTIADGIVLIRGDRIEAVGPAAEIELPADAEVLEYPDGHVYPGLVDALTDAFLDSSLRQPRLRMVAAQRTSSAPIDLPPGFPANFSISVPTSSAQPSTVDAATALVDGLQLRGDREDDLVEAGITTAYVGNKSTARWRGLGVIIRPTSDGFEVFTDKDRAALQVRLTNGPTSNSHALNRQNETRSTFKVFDDLEKYRESFEKHEEALEKYNKEFAEYIAYHRKKNGKEEAAEGEGDEEGNSGSESSGNAPENAGPPRRGGTRRGRGEGGGRGERGGRGGRGERGGRGGPRPQGPGGERGGPRGRPAPQQDPQANKPDPAKPASGDEKPKEGDKDDKAPERPKYPKPPRRDPVKDALLEVLDNNLPLRAEAHRADEITTTLAQAQKHDIINLVIEDPLDGAAVASQLANAGIPCVLTELWPQASKQPYENEDLAALPAALDEQGVAFAIATGSGRRAQALPMLAAIAVGQGLSHDTALRAITLTPAEILGIQKDVGSLQEGKMADILVSDRPLLDSDSKLLRVMSSGKTRFEAEEGR